MNLEIIIEFGVVQDPLSSPNVIITRFSSYTLVEAEDEMDMPGGEQQHRDDVQRHFQRLMDRVRREPEP